MRVTTSAKPAHRDSKHSTKTLTDNASLQGDSSTLSKSPPTPFPDRTFASYTRYYNRHSRVEFELGFEFAKDGI